jgi:hypothetical protein
LGSIRNRDKIPGDISGQFFTIQSSNPQFFEKVKELRQA